MSTHIYCMCAVAQTSALFCDSNLYRNIYAHTCRLPALPVSVRGRCGAPHRARISGAHERATRARAQNIITMTDLSDSFVFMSVCRGASVLVGSCVCARISGKCVGHAHASARHEKPVVPPSRWRTTAYMYA